MKHDLPLFQQAHARQGDPETSHEAAASVASEKILDTQWKIMLLLWDFGIRKAWSDEEIHQHWRWQWKPSVSGLRSRRAELVKMGYVEHSGEYTKTASGRRARLWRLTWKGREKAFGGRA